MVEEVEIKDIELRRHVDEYIDARDGTWFYRHHIWKEYNVNTTHGKKTVWWRLNERVNNNELIQEGDRYRRLLKDVDEMDWQDAPEGDTLSLLWPFDLEKHVDIYPGNLGMIAGTSNSGKTAFCNSFVVMNMDNFQVDLYNSEIGAQQFKDRMRPYDIPYPAPFRVYSRTNHFADVINPDHISVVDYIEYITDVKEIKEEIENLFRKLKGGKGMCFCAIQKKFDAKNFKGQKIIHDLGYGAETTLARPSLYLTMNPGNLKILKAKTPKVEHSVDGKTWRYALVEGAHFTSVAEIDSNG